MKNNLTLSALNGNTEISHIEFNSANFKWTIHQRVNGYVFNSELGEEFAKNLINGLKISPSVGTTTWEDYRANGNKGNRADTHIVYYMFPHLQDNGDYKGDLFINKNAS